MQGSGTGTIPLAINAAGRVTGYYIDSNFNAHGFSRDVNGKVTTFDAPLASTICPFGATYPNGINAAGEVTGYYYDSTCNPHGFLREQNGAFTVVDVPNFIGTFPVTINDGGKIEGWGGDAVGMHGFIRDQRGSYTVFDIPGVRDFGGMDINPGGVIAGTYFDANLVSHGFRRLPDGTLSIIDVPSAGTGFLQGTYASSISPVGAIAGNYTDANGVAHGFLFQPQ